MELARIRPLLDLMEIRIVSMFLEAALRESAVGAVAFDEATAKDSADYGEAGSSDEKKHASRDVAGEVGDEEDCYPGVDEDGEEIAKGASRHNLPLWRGWRRR